MNTVQLECFVTVAEHLNFSKASRVLKITQPAVSHQIQTLEEELDVKLINYPGASTQALCSAPTSPLTALAFRSCSRRRESGV